MSKKKVLIDFSEYWGGLNLIDSPLNFAKNQTQDGTQNAILTKKGQEKRNGTLGLSATQTFTTFVKLLEIYRQFDGTEKLIALSGGKLYDVNKTTEALTQRYDLTGTGEGVGKTYKDKFWICNGSEVVKLENETAYQVGITAPNGSTATGSGSGGSLLAGTYKIFISYYRKVGGVIKLYSVGESVSDVALAGSTSKISFTVPDSSDLQVNGVVVWMTDANGTTYYSYHNEDGSGSYSFDITSDSAKNTSLLYTVEAIANQRPPAFSYLEFHNNRMYGIHPTNLSDVHYSIKASDVYDLEKFPNITGETNVITYPFEVTGLYSLGDHLYINTKGGFIVQPFGDPATQWQWVDKQRYFDKVGTVAHWGRSLIGLTNDGVRIFDGISFSSDLSFFVRPEIEKALSSPTNHLSRGIVYDRIEKREEYHLTYQDTSLGTATGNRRLVLNLSSLAFFEGGDVGSSWEIWTNGADYMAIGGGGDFFQCQSHTSNSHIYKETSLDTTDKAVYDEAGTFQTTTYNYAWKIISRIDLPSMTARIRLTQLRAVVRTSSEIIVTIKISDRFGISDDNVIGSGGGVARFGIARFGVDRFSAQIDEFVRVKYNMNLKGYSAYVEIEQEKNDINARIIKLLLEGSLDESIFT